jgi:predicted ATPase
VQAVIRARLDRLDHYARESLRTASVIGREFARRILDRISISRDQLAQSLETLKVLELIQQIQVVPEAAYVFKHVLTQEVTYETLLLQKRKELHGLVGQAIEDLYQERIEEQVNLLYHHFNLAEN